MDLNKFNKLYKKYEWEVDGEVDGYVDKVYAELLILFRIIEDEFFELIINEIFDDDDISNVSTYGGDWLLYEWDRYLDEIAADENMRTICRFNEVINKLKCIDASNEKLIKNKAFKIHCLFQIQRCDLEMVNYLSYSLMRWKPNKKENKK